MGISALLLQAVKKKCIYTIAMTSFSSRINILVIEIKKTKFVNNVLD